MPGTTEHNNTVDEIAAVARQLSDAAAADLLTLVRAWHEAEAGGVPYRPTPLAGLWSGTRISDEDITAARREAWDQFGVLE